jgi:hypothetical protein
MARRIADNASAIDEVAGNDWTRAQRPGRAVARGVDELEVDFFHVEQRRVRGPQTKRGRRRWMFGIVDKQRNCVLAIVEPVFFEVHNRELSKRPFVYDQVFCSEPRPAVDANGQVVVGRVSDGLRGVKRRPLP